MVGEVAHLVSEGVAPTQSRMAGEIRSFGGEYV